MRFDLEPEASRLAHFLLTYLICFRQKVILYSCHDRPKDQELVARLSEELTKVSCD